MRPPNMYKPNENQSPGTSQIDTVLRLPREQPELLLHLPPLQLSLHITCTDKKNKQFIHKTEQRNGNMDTQKNTIYINLFFFKKMLEYC